MDPSQDTWEPSAHILCKQMIEEFENEWRQVEDRHAISAVKLPVKSGGGPHKRSGGSADGRRAKKPNDQMECYSCEKYFAKKLLTTQLGDLYCKKCLH
eukprot:gene14923-1137_t